jgi:hypothetical protein
MYDLVISEKGVATPVLCCCVLGVEVVGKKTGNELTVSLSLLHIYIQS